VVSMYSPSSTVPLPFLSPAILIFTPPDRRRQPDEGYVQVVFVTSVSSSRLSVMPRRGDEGGLHRRPHDGIAEIELESDGEGLLRVVPGNDAVAHGPPFLSGASRRFQGSGRLGVFADGNAAVREVQVPSLSFLTKSSQSPFAPGSPPARRPSWCRPAVRRI